jgi:hypothetical protein
MELDYYTYADDIEDLRTAHFEKMGKPAPIDNIPNKIWNICVDIDKCKAVGCMSYTVSDQWLMIHDFYVSNPRAVLSIEDYIDCIQKEVNLPIAATTDYDNEKWNKVLLKKGYIPNTIIWTKGV